MWRMQPQFRKGLGGDSSRAVAVDLDFAGSHPSSEIFSENSV